MIRDSNAIRTWWLVCSASKGRSKFLKERMRREVYDQVQAEDAARRGHLRQLSHSAALLDFEAEIRSKLQRNRC